MRLTEAYRRQTLILRAATIRDLQRLWPALDWTRLDRTYPAWLVGVETLVQRDRRTAAGLASAYLRAIRASSGIPGEAVVLLAAAAPAEQVETALRVTTLVAAKKASAAGMDARAAMASAFVQSSGAATRIVMDAGRETIMASAVADPRAAGWQRVTGGRACQFCLMLTGRGAVYSEASADFASHDHCACSAEPVYQ